MAVGASAGTGGDAKGRVVRIERVAGDDVEVSLSVVEDVSEGWNR